MHPTISGRTAVRLSLAVSSVVFLACGGDTQSPTPVPAPVISSFAAAPATINAGQSSVLSWSVSGATTVSLDQGIGTVTTSSTTVNPEATTTYTLTATNATGKVTKTAMVTVNPIPVPVISTFVATPASILAGGSSVLSWSVTGETTLSIDNGVGTVAGTEITVNPTVTTTYTLTAVNDGGNATKTAAVTVIAPATGAYFGQTLPGETPVRFAADILSTLSAFPDGPTFSPDGTQMFVSVGDASYSSGKLYFSNSVSGEWTPFAEPSFVSTFTFAVEPVFSADGKTLTFTGKKATEKPDFYTVDYTEQGWGTPVVMPPPINSDFGEWRGSTMNDGTLYFASTRSGMAQIYKATKDASQTTVVELVGAPISTNSYDGDPCIAPDGRFLIFYSCRGGGKGGSDLYVSFSDGSGGWGTPINLGGAYNAGDDEYGAHLSADGNYLFYTRHNSQGNSIYWVATSAIDKLKP